MPSHSLHYLVPGRHVVVDGSNIATEGRSLPSLAQLDEAVREYRREFADDVITVVVDATFGHRIDPSERSAFDDAVAHNEIVSPPAGAIGRGDAFLLRVAEKVGATVLSNDSFQEFHGEHDWLFNNGRLIGGKPVPGVGWIFTPRTPVRGPRSRDAVREARRTARAPRDDAGKVEKAIAVATEEAVEPSRTRRRRRRGRGGTSTPPAEPVNEPLPFIEFVAAHPLGSSVEGEVESFSSHGAFVVAGAVRCYVPLSGLGDPPPRAAKEVLKRGETRSFVLQALDPPRRGIELALAEFAHVSGAPTEETVEEEIKEAAARSRPSRRRRGRGAGEGDGDAPAAVDAVAEAVADAAAETAAEPQPAVGPQPAAGPRPAKKAARAGKAAKAPAKAPAKAAQKAPTKAAKKAAEAAPAKKRRRGADAVPVPEPVLADATGPIGEAPAAAAPAAGPRKRPARPRAGAPRAREPAAAPASARKRTAARKAPEPQPEPVAPAEAAPEPGPRKRRAKAPATEVAAAEAAAPKKAVSRKRAAKAAPGPAPAAEPATEAAAKAAATPKKAASKRAAKKASVAEQAAVEAPAPAKKARRRGADQG